MEKAGCIFTSRVVVYLHTVRGLGHSDILLYVTAGWVVLAPRFCIPLPIESMKKRSEIAGCTTWRACIHMGMTRVIYNKHYSQRLIAHHVQPRSRKKMTRSSRSPLSHSNLIHRLHSLPHIKRDQSQTRKEKNIFVLFETNQRTHKSFLGAYHNLLRTDTRVTTKKCNDPRGGFLWEYKSYLFSEKKRRRREREADRQTRHENSCTVSRTDAIPLPRVGQDICHHDHKTQGKKKDIQRIHCITITRREKKFASFLS